MYRKIKKAKSVIVRYNDKPKPFMSWTNDI